ncbi:MAG: KpsF/GutQ family sugar-phosphate isomerase [Bdellovibrionaceae bacterium]|nr:KpsF/GutQ family sugar-phosphate isomerase [Pseudobdellovibrionaceae bacterium]
MSQEILDEGKRVLQLEAQSILQAADKLNGSFVDAVGLVKNCRGKVVITGMGKSGHIARKLAATFSSTGTPSFFLHPAESSHGDMGVISEQDLVIAISNGGESTEMIPIYSYCSRKDIPLIAITGNLNSTLARTGRVTLEASVKEEACPLGLAPTSSTTVTLALGDALAMAVLKEKGFRKEDFAEFHPGGKLGRKLLLRVKDLMHTAEALPLVGTEEKISQVISLMTAQQVRGVSGVVDNKGSLIGAITDGDIRRKLQKSNFSLDETAINWMSRDPKTIDCNELAEKALFLMEQFKIDRLFAVDKTAQNPQRAVGLIHIQDLLQANIR